MTKTERLKVLKGLSKANKVKAKRFWTLFKSEANAWDEIEVTFVEVRTGRLKEYVYNQGEHNFIFDDLRVLNQTGA